MNKRDLILLKMMLDDINKINRKLNKFNIKSFDDFCKDEDIYESFYPALVNLYEKYTKLSDEFLVKKSKSFVKLKVARNIISHAYKSVNLDIIWELIENYLPVLSRDISREIEEL